MRVPEQWVVLGVFPVLAVLFLLPASGQSQVGREAVPPDLAGEWALANDEDPGQPPLGDYTGIPFNAAGRLRSETTAESIWGTPEYQCRPHSFPHQWRGLGGTRILDELDPLTRNVRAYHLQYWRSLDRPIFMDGRPHPPAWAPHSWTGFSTGEWVGNTLVVTTTHLKDGFLKRGGPQTSDMYTMTEYITRHGDILTIVQVVDDPIYLDEPYVESTTYTYDPGTRVIMETCVGSSVGDIGGNDPHHVPHFLPGQNPALTEWLEEDDWVPVEVIGGGVKTLYPEYRSVLAGETDAASLPVPRSASAISPDSRIAAQSPRDGRIHVLPVQGNIYMVIADGTNLTASVGPDGVMLVNTGSAGMADQVLAAVGELADEVASRAVPNDCFGADCARVPSGWTSPYMNAIISSPAPARPVRHIVDTSAAPDHTGGNALLSANDWFQSTIAHENVLFRMLDAGADPDALPNDAYFLDFYKLTGYFNGEGVVTYHAPAANTDGDSFVFFRHSEVIAAGDLFSTVSYPRIDIEKGGSVQGVIDGLNQILDLAIPEYRGQGGTWIIPGRGRLSDAADVGSYRNMVVIVRDRVQSLIDEGKTLEEVWAARPTLDFDPRYGTVDTNWTPGMFVEAVYRSLTEDR